VSDERYRCSFDGVADVYERSRPGYAAEAVAWIAERLPFRRVLDLGAGTGKLTRQLVPFAAEVVAVEPGDEMRRVLQEVVPGVEALFGTAEDIPLPDASVDAITVAQAFHWFEVDEALAEMHRVLRPGGGYAIVWNEWDDDDALLEAINAVIGPLRPTRRDEAVDKKAQIVASELFASKDERSFPNIERVDAERVVEQVSSISAIAAATPDARRRALDEVRELVGEGAVDFRMYTHVIAADRA
jgi:ubiquinone/menaquinone biosynthesis C-methylase UbiE